MMAEDTDEQRGTEYFEGVDEDTVLHSSQAPLIQWVNGEPRGAPGTIAHTGGWFLPADQSAETPGGFTPFTLHVATGKEVEGYACRAITVALLRWRSQWLVAGAQGNVMFPWRCYDEAKALGGQKSPRGHTHALVILRGAEDEGMFCLTMKGMTAKALTSRGGIIECARQHLLAPAKTLGKASQGKQFAGLPLHAFWLVLGPEMQGGAPCFTEVGQPGQSSRITLLTCQSFPAEPIKTMHFLLPHLVPVQIRRDNDMLWQESHAWALAWDGAREPEHEPEADDGPDPREVPCMAEPPHTDASVTHVHRHFDAETRSAWEEAAISGIAPQPQPPVTVHEAEAVHRKHALAKMCILAFDQGLSPRGFRVWSHVMSGRSRTEWSVSDIDRYTKAPDGFTGKNETQLLEATRAQVYHLGSLAHFPRTDLDDWCGTHGVIQADEAGWDALEQLAGWLRDKASVAIMREGGHPESSLWTDTTVSQPAITILAQGEVTAEDVLFRPSGTPSGVDAATGEVLDDIEEEGDASTPATLRPAAIHSDWYLEFEPWLAALTQAAETNGLPFKPFELYVKRRKGVRALRNLTPAQRVEVGEWLAGLSPTNLAWTRQQLGLPEVAVEPSAPSVQVEGEENYAT